MAVFSCGRIWKEFQDVLEAQTFPPYILVSAEINNQEISSSDQLRFFYSMMNKYINKASKAR